jgi:hypothetical protein
MVLAKKARAHSLTLGSFSLFGSSQELLVMIVDVSPSMHANLKLLGDSVTELFHKRVLFERDRCQAALLLSGSDGALAPRSDARGSRVSLRSDGQRAERGDSRPVRASAGERGQLRHLL